MLIESLILYITRREVLYQLAFSGFIYWMIQIFRFYKQRHERYKLFHILGIPGPEPSLLDGNYRDYYVNGTLFETEVEMNKKFGPTYGVWFADWRAIITTDPAIIKRVFIDPDPEEIFGDRTKHHLDTNVSHSILLAKRNRWRVFRKRLAVPFTRFTNRRDQSVQFVEDSAQLMLDYIDKRLEEAKRLNKEANIDLYDILKAAALYLISELVVKLPVEIKENDSNVRGLVDYLHTVDGKIFKLSLYLPQLVKPLGTVLSFIQTNQTMAFLYKSFNESIALAEQKLNLLTKEEVKTSKEENILDLLIKLKHQGEITHKEVLGNIEALLLAGFDTTSTTLIYTFWLLAKHQDVQQKLADDLVLKGTESRYLEQVINESMRLHPVVCSFVSRVSSKTVVINGVKIPNRSLVVYNTYVMHRNPKYWPEPDKFDPERFRDGVEIDPYYFAPFGFGERRCLGYKLALLELKILISELILNYKLELISPQELKMKVCTLTLTQPADKIRLNFVKRNP